MILLKTIINNVLFHLHVEFKIVIELSPPLIRNLSSQIIKDGGVYTEVQ